MAKKAKKAKKAKAKKAKAKNGGRGGFLAAAALARPVAPFMCFRTADPNIFIKCDWNPVEQRFNLNCRPATRDECQE